MTTRDQPRRTAARATEPAPKRDRTKKITAAPPGFSRVAVFAKNTGKGINQIYAACNADELPHVRIGKTIFIPDDAFERLLARAAARPEKPQ